MNSWKLPRETLEIFRKEFLNQCHREINGVIPEATSGKIPSINYERVPDKFLNFSKKSLEEFLKEYLNLPEKMSHWMASYEVIFEENS